MDRTEVNERIRRRNRRELVLTVGSKGYAVVNLSWNRKKNVQIYTEKFGSNWK